MSYTLNDLLDEIASRTSYTWLAGKSSTNRKLDITSARSGLSSLAGRLNLIQPNQIQLLGQIELDYLDGLKKASFNDALDHLFSARTVLVIVEMQGKLPKQLVALATMRKIGLISTPMNSYDLLHDLHYVFSRLFAENKTFHGVFLEVAGKGILLQGQPGIGKSEVALELITRGHRLIADDAVEFSKNSPTTVSGSCSTLLQDFLEVRGLGILNIKTLYGDNAIKYKKNLMLIVQLVDSEVLHEDGTNTSRLHGIHDEIEIIGVTFPRTTLPVAAGRNLAVMIEVTVRNHLIKQTGVEAFDDLHQRLLEQMNESKP